MPCAVQGSSCSIHIRLGGSLGLPVELPVPSIFGPSAGVSVGVSLVQGKSVQSGSARAATCSWHLLEITTCTRLHKSNERQITM